MVTKCRSVMPAAKILILSCAAVFFGACIPTSDEDRQRPTELGRQQPGSPHPIFDRTESELKRASVKVTWLGVQVTPIPTVVFDSANFRPAPDDFRRFQNGVVFGNDNLSLSRFSVTPAELKRMLALQRPIASKLLPTSEREHVSVTLVRDLGGKYEGFEFRVGKNDAEEFYIGLLNALNVDNNQPRLGVIEQFDAVVPRNLRKQEPK
jgi:hypothetical protein